MKEDRGPNRADVLKENNSAFLNMLSDINDCRKAGFLRPALVLALCIPDFCRKQEQEPRLYEDWCRVFGDYLLNRYYDGLYSARNNAVHEMTPKMRNILDFSGAATVEFPAQTIPAYVPTSYQTVNAGALIIALIGAGRRFYENSTEEIKQQLNSVDDYFVLNLSELLLGKGNKKF